MALRAKPLDFLRLLSDLLSQNRYQGDDEERRIQVCDKVGFAERIVCEDCLCMSKSVKVKYASTHGRMPYTSQEVGHRPKEDSYEQEQ